VGTALGPQGCEYHGVLQGVQRQDLREGPGGLIIPVVITIFSDRSFTFITKTPPVPRAHQKARRFQPGEGVG